MTLTMQDSISVANLTADADAYLGYVNGRWPTYNAVRARFPGKPVIGMTVFAGVNAEGCDCENGDLTPAQVPAFVKVQQARGVWRPVVYASASNVPVVLAELTTAGVARSSIRLLSAHYGSGNHVCGPLTCRYPDVPPCDGTQWTDEASGTGGALIDESVLLSNFFDPKPAPAPEPPVSTPVTVTADGTKTLSEIAVANKTAPAGILRATAVADGLFAANLAAWIDGAIGEMVVPAGVALRIPG